MAGIAFSACAAPVSPSAVSTSVPTLPSVPTLASSSPTPDQGNLDDDIGSVLVASWSGGAITPGVNALLDDGRVGGVLLFSSNFAGPAGLKALSDQLSAVSSRECLDHPILVMLDEEGGQVNRVQAPFAPPSELVAGYGGPQHVESLEQASAAGLRSLGVGLNLAPVADVRTNPLDAVITDRSFGSDPSKVAPLVAAAVEGLHAGGVGATLKHFPGLGGAPGDPHVAIPTDTESESRWESVQMPAFQAGITAGADAVMTTAVYVPGLGGGTMPAMFSSAVVGRLRTQLDFKGVIISDSVSMGGIGAHWPLPEATVMALAAGNDLVLLGNGDPVYELEAVAAVKAAVLSGRLSRTALHQAAMRVNALRDEYGRRFVHCRPPITAP
jgi:beta-N-acetylhexosaminidase